MTNPESTAIDPVAAMGTDHTEAPAHPLHKVLSFVRRSGRLDDRLQRAWDNYAGTYLLDIAAGNLLDVRDGPVVMIDERTFVFAFLESAGQTEQALLEDLRKRTGYVVSLGPFAAAEGEDRHFDTGEITDPVAAAIPALYLLQNVALYKALKRGVDPDRPNGLSAWIRL